MKSFLQFLSESDSSSEFSTAVDRLLSQLKGTKLIDPDTGLPKPLYRGTSARPNFDFAETGNISPRHQTWGPGQYWSTSPSYAGRYTKIIPSSTKIEQPWFLRPFISPITKTAYSYAPGSRIITAYANIENPIEMGYGANIQQVGERLGIPTPNVNDRHNPNYLAQINDALNKRGIDAIKAYDKNVGELVSHEIWNIRDPKKVILSPHVLAPQTTQTTSPKPPTPRPTPRPTTPKPPVIPISSTPKLKLPTLGQVADVLDISSPGAVATGAVVDLAKANWDAIKTTPAWAAEKMGQKVETPDAALLGQLQDGEQERRNSSSRYRK